MKEIDARGLACPAPVLQTKSALQEAHPGRVRVVVDNAAAQQNVQRFFESQGFQCYLKEPANIHTRQVYNHPTLQYSLYLTES